MTAFFSNAAAFWKNAGYRALSISSTKSVSAPFASKTSSACMMNFAFGMRRPCSKDAMVATE